MKILKILLIGIIKLYKLMISPLIGNNCRYLPTCSDYFIDCLNEYGLIKINKKVIGLLVPSTIICPARYYGKSIDNSIPWFQVGKLIDPCLAADIRSEEFSVLINFIEQFEQGLAKESMSNQEYFDGILGALTSFKDDAEKRIRESGQAKINLHGFKRVNTSFKLPFSTISPFFSTITLSATSAAIPRSCVMSIKPIFLSSRSSASNSNIFA